jgi:hypothetical protein
MLLTLLFAKAAVSVISNAQAILLGNKRWRLNELMSTDVEPEGHVSLLRVLALKQPKVP